MSSQIPLGKLPEKLKAPKLKNLTHYAKLTKSSPTSPLIAAIDRAQTVLDGYVKDLAKDPTRTSSQKLKLIHEAAQSQSMNLLKQVDSHRNKITDKLADYNKKVSDVLRIKGTTDMMLLSNMAAATADLSNVELHSLGKTEPDALRAALLLPVERFKRNIKSKPETESYLKEALVEVTLGTDYSVYQSLLSQEAEAHDLGNGILESHAESVNAYNKIDDQVAIAPVVG